MRAELPWNVAGIPPEAREAARAAARREGLSVGEWLTRRILRSFSDLGEEPSAPMALDPWGLPPSSASRRETEEMLARVSRSESEAGDVYRRVEEQLRGVGRRLDSAERGQSENNRAITKTATEINIAAREQAQAFDQLSAHVIELGDRLARVERSAAQDGLKDAVKGLHQGLSRVADQITQTANQSATQVSALAGNLEQLAARLGQVRHDAEGAARALEDRVATVEKNAQVTADVLDHAMGNLETRASNQAAEQVEVQRRNAETQGHIERLDDAIAKINTRGPDPAITQRIEGVEHTLGEVISRLENPAPIPAIEDQLRRLTSRLDAVEKNWAEVAPRETPPAPEPARSAPPVSSALFASSPPAPEAPPFAEPPPFAADPPPFDTAHFNAPPFGADASAHDPFAPIPDFVDPFAPAEAPTPADGENFLAQARRSVRNAAAQGEADRGWNASKKTAGTSRSPLVIAGLVALIIIVALLAGTILNQRMRAPQPGGLAGMFPPKSSTAPIPVPPPATGTTSASTTPHAQPPATSPAKLSAPRPQAATAPKVEPKGVQPLQPRDVRPAPIHTVPPAAPAPQAAAQAIPAPVAPAPASTPSAKAPVDRLTTLANAGNPIAQTIVGLKYLDGQGAAADPAQAVKWLQRAADQNQPVAQYRLGTLYERGQGVAADPAKAAHWYEAAANQGNRKAMHNLAVAYAEGSTGKKDMAEASRWFTKAANLGLADSQFNLAVLYERGDGVPQSLLDAFKWYSIGAAQGDSESKSRLAVLQAQVSDSDRAAAQRSAASFHAAPLNRTANVPPEMADLPAN